MNRPKLREISFIFLPGYADIREYKSVDRRSGIVDGEAICRADIFFFNCLQGDMVREKCNDCESGTLNRFYDRQVKRRVARQEHVAGNHKRLVN